MSEVAIEVENLVFEYPLKRALHSVSFAIPYGAVVALVGPNGAGKTTLLQCVAALEAPFLGRVRVCGLDTETSPRECHLHLAYLADTFGLYEELSAERCLRHAAAMRGLDETEAKGAIDDAIDALDLSSFISNRAGDLSRGQRQRLAIAQTILHRPKVLLLDEPASGLDPEARAELAELIKRLAKQGMTIVVSSHILAELQDYSSHMLTIENGRIAGFEQISHPGSSPDSNLERSIRVRLLAPDARLVSWLKERALEVQSAENAVTELTLRGAPSAQFELLRSLIEAGFAVTEFAEQRVSLQERYLAQRRARREDA